MDYNRNMTESLVVLGTVKPQAAAAGTYTAGPFNLLFARRIVGRIHVGALGGGTVDAKFQASATSGGTYADVANAAIATINSGSENVAQVELKGETLAGAGQGPWVKLLLTVTGGTGTQLSAIVEGGVSGYEPASDNNVATVTQTVVA